MTVPGTYEVVFEVTNSLNEKTIKAMRVQVLEKVKPVITTTEATVFTGQSFDPLDYVSVTDEVDGDTLIPWVISNTVDMATPGTYEVTYEATNSLNETTTQTLNVEVLPRSLPKLEANDLVIHVGDAFDPLKHVVATDEYDGVLTPTVSENTVDPSTVGAYQVTYEVVNSQGERIGHAISVMVIDPNETDTSDTTDDLTVPPTDEPEDVAPLDPNPTEKPEKPTDTSDEASPEPPQTEASVSLLPAVGLSLICIGLLVRRPPRTEKIKKSK